ncbi:MAG TPA: DMT family transporter [Acidimicrobiales bacterium]|nr:DMT family transporter [Acidimicrobiales bacterium]
MDDHQRRVGVLLCIGSAAAFGALPIFGKIAFDHGLDVVTFLFIRFSIASAVLWILVAVRRERVGGHARRLIIGGIVMGVAGYGIQSTMYFLALERIDASLSALLLYAYPAIVTGAAIVLGRERGTPALLGALGVASLGTLLLLSDGLRGDADSVGVLLGLASAICYSAYILAGDTLVASLPPLVLAALVTGGGAGAFGVWGTATQSFDFGVDGTAYLAVVGAAIVGTVLSVGTLLAGIERVGASMASVLSTVEPATTVLLAIVFLGESAVPIQLGGGALLIVAIVLCQRARRPFVELEPVPGVPA